MKTKINFSGARIKKFFANHGEKVVLAATAVLLLLFLYSAITAKPLDDSKSPDAIKRESAQLASNIQVPTWPEEETKLGLTTPHFKEVIDESMRPIPGLRLRQAREWNPPLFPELIKRVDPEIYGVEELQIASGRGIVAYRPAAAANPGGPGAFRPGANGPGVRGRPIYPPAAGPGMGGPPIGPPGLFGRPGAPYGGEEMGGGPAQSSRVGFESLPGVHAPGADTEPKTYVVLTGIVPVEKEVDEYRRRFEYAMPAIIDTNRQRGSMQMMNQEDVPHYFCFLVDRAEVKDANDKTRNWTPILSKANYVNSEAMKDLAKWFSQAPEIVHPDDVFQVESAGAGQNQFNAYITWPLPPLMLRNWGFEAAHPKVKLNIAQEATPENQPEGNQNSDNLETVTPESRGNGRFGPPGMPGAGHGPPPAAYAHGPPSAAMGPGAAGRFPQMQAGETFNDPYKLFRFVDLTAEPGKTYRYRVQILVYNPNFGLVPECLDPKAIQAGTEKKRLADSPWAETAPITVPYTYQVLAEGINVPGGRLSELKARINLLALAKTPAAESQTGSPAANSDTYVEIVKEIEGGVPLGGIVYLRDAEIDKVPDLSSESIRKVEKISVDTDQTVLLDVRNDKPLGEGKSKDATEMMLMDGAGNLYNANRAADKLVLEDYQARTKVATEAKETSEPVSPRPGSGIGPGRPTSPGGGPKGGRQRP